MKLHEVVDEFQNKEFENDVEKRRHLFRVQAARCNEINLFILKLARQFPDWWKTEGKEQWQDHPVKDWDDTPARQFGNDDIVWMLPKLGSKVNTQQIRDSFKAKYYAMISAKRAYEQAGGIYRG